MLSTHVSVNRILFFMGERRTDGEQTASSKYVKRSVKQKHLENMLDPELSIIPETGSTLRQSRKNSNFPRQLHAARLRENFQALKLLTSHFADALRLPIISAHIISLY
jgi:hypothetical protein